MFFFLPPDLPWIYHVLYLNDSCLRFSSFVLHPLCLCRDPHLSWRCKCPQENWEAPHNLTLARYRIPPFFLHIFSCTHCILFSAVDTGPFDFRKISQPLSHSRCEWDPNSKMHSALEWLEMTSLIYFSFFPLCAIMNKKTKRKININQMCVYRRSHLL